MIGSNYLRSCGVVFLILLTQNIASGQDANCDYFQNVLAGTTYYVYSPNYPNSYNRPSSCRWQASCPANTFCRLQCSEISIPSTTGCSGDRLLVSKTGDSALTGAEKYCGTGSLDIVSSSNRISVGLIALVGSAGGRFMCTLTSTPATAPTTAPSTCIDCGWKRTSRIVGGVQTLVNEYPMMVGLVDVTLKIVYCGGTIITTRWVLTAAHCLDNQQASNVAVLYGEHNLRVGTETTGTTLVPTDQLIRHPLVNDYQNDIGLVRTTKIINFSTKVGPACLPFSLTSYNFNGKTVTDLGWGTTSFGGPDSDYLRKVALTIYDQTSCANTLGSVVTSNIICTYAAGKDACQHDSGGPLLWQSPTNGRVYVIGIIAGGYGCAINGKPGLNTRVTPYLNWIATTTGTTNFCKY
nr:serine protease 2 [Limnephilus flavicornis]